MKKVNAHPGFPRRLAVLGSTGSIGKKALAVVERYPDRFQTVGISAHQSGEAVLEQAKRLGIPQVVLTDKDSALEVSRNAGPDVKVLGGPESAVELASRDDVDLVVNGIVGRAGLEASLAAVKSGKMLALANKESLVLAGELIMRTARENGARVIPVDSEHSGLFQCLEHRDPAHVDRLILTASGGPFRGRSANELLGVTPEEALNHPVWPMGPRISIDSATLFNKGLEVIETHWLFDVPLDRIEVWVHPQSVVHALVELTDQTLFAQLSTPDMIFPVQYAMSYPERWGTGEPRCSLPLGKDLGFESPDLETFPALKLAYHAAERGGTAPTLLNAADEIAIEAFLSGRLGFTDIPRVVEAVLCKVPIRPADSLEAVTAADAEGREAARALLEARTL